MFTSSTSPGRRIGAFSELTAMGYGEERDMQTQEFAATDVLLLICGRETLLSTARPHLRPRSRLVLVKLRVEVEGICSEAQRRAMVWAKLGDGNAHDILQSLTERRRSRSREEEEEEEAEWMDGFG